MAYTTQFQEIKQYNIRVQQNRKRVTYDLVGQNGKKFYKNPTLNENDE